MSGHIVVLLDNNYQLLQYNFIILIIFNFYYP